jgi:hypothetical protein
MGWFDRGAQDKRNNPNAQTKTPEQLKNSTAREAYNAGLKQQEQRQREEQNRRNK